ncbi:MAG TPA: adenylate/guanylate cyclase domain-containing protein [Candidatus Tectomicrobia bacterium]|nr:adenylate/guanylate cyclase domain-containing protein [Candidatus Tectomicrobia bacterium]
MTVLFADLKGSMEVLAERDPEEARQLLDPVLERLMGAVHRYEGTVNQVMGDGIMALFGAPIAHEDHAMRACYAALAMQDAIRRYSEEVRRAHGIEVQIRVGLNSGEVVVRSIAAISPWITRRWARRRTWQPAWNSSPPRGAFDWRRRRCGWPRGSFRSRRWDRCP